VKRGALEEVPADYPYSDMLRKQPADLLVGRVNIYSE
jgi:hypothetical protein